MCKWCHELKNDDTAVRGGQKCGRLSAVTDELAQKDENAVRGEARLTSDELSSIVPRILRSLKLLEQ